MALEFYQLKRDSGSVILPKSKLATCVATKGNISFVFNTGLKQDIPVDAQRTIEKDVIEQYDIKVTEDAEELLYDIMVIDYRIVDLFGEVQKLDPSAQVRYPEPPALTFKDKGVEVIIPSATLQNIAPSQNTMGIIITTRDNKTYHFNGKDGFEFSTFIESLQRDAIERLTATLNLADYGITSLAE